MAEDQEVAEMILDNNDRMSSQETAFLKKYFTLRKKCEQMQQANEKLVNRLQHVKKIIKKYKRERRVLVHRLDEYGDNYRDVQVPVMWEEDQLYSFLKPPPPYPDTPADSASVPPSDSLGPPTDTIAPPTLSPGLGIESLSTVHPILAGLGGGDSGNLSTPGPSPSATKHKRVKTEKDKDPNAPKKPANAFLMFCQQQRNTVLEEYHKEKTEEISHQELTRRLAHRWKALGQEGKKIYYEMYEREKERYDREVKEYTAKEVNATAAMEEEVNVTDNPVSVIDLLKSELL